MISRKAAAAGFGVLVLASGALAGCGAKDPPAETGKAGYYRGPMVPIRKSQPAGVSPKGTGNAVPRSTGKKGSLG